MIHLRNLVIEMRKKVRQRRDDSAKLISEAIVLEDAAFALDDAINKQEKANALRGESSMDDRSGQMGQ